MGGGYPRKGLVLLDIDENVSFPGQMQLFGPVMENFLLQGRGILILLSSKRNKDIVTTWVNNTFGERSRTNINIVDFNKNSIAKLGKSVSGLFEHTIKEAYCELKFNLGKPILTVTDIIGLEHLIGGENVDPDERMKLSMKLMDMMVDNSDLTIGLMGPGVNFAEKQKYLSDIHLKLFNRDNSLFIHGEKPNTNLYNITMTQDEHPKTIFIPLV